MKITPLPIESEVTPGFTHKVIITAADLTAANVTQVFQLIPEITGNLPIGTEIVRAGYRLITAFNNGTGNAMTLAIADGATTYIAASSVKQGVAPVTHMVGGSVPKVFLAADFLKATFLCTTDLASTYAAFAPLTGEVHVYFKIGNWPMLDKN